MLDNILNDLQFTDKSYTQIAKENNTNKVRVSYWAKRLRESGREIPERKVGRVAKKL